MQRFSALYAALDATTSTQAKVAAMADYFAEADDADAAWAVFILAGGKLRQVVPTRLLREVAMREAEVPDWLFEESYQAVGDLAETIAHLLPGGGRGDGASLAAWIEGRLLPLRGLPPGEAGTGLVAAWRDLDALGRFVWNKLITGGLRVGVAKPLVARAVAKAAGIEPRLVVERMMGEFAPEPAHYRALLADEGADERAGRPYPFFLAHPIAAEPASLGPVDHWQAEWKWDGIRAQVVRRAGRIYLWSRGEELVTDIFPEVSTASASLPEGTVIDGELLAWRDGAPLPFALLQQRLGRKTFTAKVLKEVPVALVAYDLLEVDGVDLRAQPLDVRRARLDALLADLDDPRIAVSPVVRAASWEALSDARAGARSRGVEGLMLKRRDSAYGAGRVKLGPGGEWWKWKLDPYSVDAVLVYAQRGHGRRASLYTDYTFAVWRGAELVPFAKAYSGLTDAEIAEVDRFVRANTREKFGPVRSVTPQLVMEIGFEGIQRSPRHKSGVAVRFPRMLRLRPDKPAAEADRLEALHALLTTPEPP